MDIKPADFQFGLIWMMANLLDQLEQLGRL
jgi:hypothetical protein